MSASKVSPDSLGSVLGQYLRKPDEQDRVFPKNKKVEIVFLIEAVNAILPRTEGVEDITLIKLPGTEYEVPVILPQKLQAVARRRMLAQLRKYRDEKPLELKKHLEALSSAFKYTKKSKGKKKEEEVSVGFSMAKKYAENPKEWNCYIQPPGGDIREATDVGMDGFCPACVLFGTVIDSNKVEGIGNESIGVKSRVEFDPAIAFLDKEKSVASYTHNKVSDGVSWTGKSLYEEQHVVPGTIFVGKVTLEDITEAELTAFLSVLAGIDRLGGRERIFGGVRVHLIGIRGGSHETVSALEIARKLAKAFASQEYPPSIEDVIQKVQGYVKDKGFEELDSESFRKKLDEMELWDRLWADTVEFDKQILKRILDLVKGAGKYESTQ